MKQTISLKLVNVVVAVAACCALLFLGFLYVKNMEQQLEKEMVANLYTVATQNALLIREHLNSDTMLLRSIARYIEDTGEAVNSPKISTMLKQFNEETNFLGMNNITADGQFISTRTNDKLSVVQEGYFQRALSGEQVVTTALDEISGQQVILQAVPIYQGTRVQGVLMGGYRPDAIRQLMAIEMFNRQGYHYIAQADGEIIVAPDHLLADRTLSSVFDGFDKATDYSNPNDMIRMREDITNGRSGEIFYSWNGMQRVANYMPIGIGGWYLISVAPRQLIVSQSAALLRATIFLLLAISIVFLLVAYYIFCLQRKNKEARRLDQRRFELLMEHTKDTIYEWNITKDEIYFSQNFWRQFGYMPIKKGFPESLCGEEIIKQEDAEVFKNMFVQMRENGIYTESKMRIKVSNGKFIWCKVTAAAVLDKHKKPCRVIGMISDIQEQYSREQENVNAAQRDPLTGLYNRNHTERKIRKYLDRSDTNTAALLVIDIDNFKRINDTLGHAGGDDALLRISACLSGLCRRSDVVGRIGGDEFVVFLTNIDSEETLHNKAQEIVDMLRLTFGENIDIYSVSVSVGIAIYPKDGDSYLEMFRRGDAALYQAKKEGKDCYRFYHPSMEAKQ